VQIPCIERNSLGGPYIVSEIQSQAEELSNCRRSAVKALTAAQLAMASNNVYSVSLDEAIAAMRLTSAEMSVKFKETSLSVSSTTPRSELGSPLILP
jgi:hypothetical protein